MPFFFLFSFRETHYTNLLLEVPTPREILQVCASIRGMCHQFVASATTSSSSSASAGY